MELENIAQSYVLIGFEFPLAIMKTFAVNIATNASSPLLHLAAFFFLTSILMPSEFSIKTRKSILKSFYKLYVTGTINVFKLETFGKKPHQVIANYLLFLIYPIVLVQMTLIVSVLMLPILVGVELSTITRTNGLLLKYVKSNEPEQLTMDLEIPKEDIKQISE